MKLATLRTDKPNGELVIVSRDLTRMCRVSDIAPTLQAALDDWARAKPLLAARYQTLPGDRRNQAVVHGKDQAGRTWGVVGIEQPLVRPAGTRCPDKVCGAGRSIARIPLFG